jgi:RNA polymerase sigma-70 factor (ECF subfamily)
MKTDPVSTFETVYESNADAVFRFCLLRVSNREQALDITQEAFLRLWKEIAKEGSHVKNPRAFLFTVANRLVIDWYRKKKSVSFEDLQGSEEGALEFDPIDETTTSEALELGAEGRFLQQSITSLSDSVRDAVYLRFVEDFSPTEIGKTLGISANAASVRINRGIEELRKKTGYDDIDPTKYA